MSIKLYIPHSPHSSQDNSEIQFSELLIKYEFELYKAWSECC